MCKSLVQKSLTFIKVDKHVKLTEKESREIWQYCFPWCFHVAGFLHVYISSSLEYNQNSIPYPNTGSILSSFTNSIPYPIIGTNRNFAFTVVVSAFQSKVVGNSFVNFWHIYKQPAKREVFLLKMVVIKVVWKMCKSTVSSIAQNTKYCSIQN